MMHFYLYWNKKFQIALNHSTYVFLTGYYAHFVDTYQVLTGSIPSGLILFSHRNKPVALPLSRQSIGWARSDFRALTDLNFVPPLTFFR